jgi:hypothetical protein
MWLRSWKHLPHTTIRKATLNSQTVMATVSKRQKMRATPISQQIALKEWMMKKHVIKTRSMTHEKTVMKTTLQVMKTSQTGRMRHQTYTWIPQEC